MGTSVKKNFIYNMAMTLGQLLIPFLSFPYLTRVLKPDGIGLISFADSIVMYLVLVASLGIPIYGVREIAKCRTKEERSQMFSEIFSLHIISIILGLVAYIIIILSFTKTNTRLPFFALGTIGYIAGNLTFEWFFQGSENYRFIAIRTLLIKVLVLISIFVFIKDQSDLLLYYIILNTGLILNTVINVIYLRKQVSFTIPDKKDIQKHIRPVFRLFATRFATSIYVVLLSALIGFLATDESVGYFSAAYKIYMVSLTGILAYNTVIIPRMTQSYVDGNEATMEYYIGRAYNFITDLAIPLSMFILINAQPIVQLMAGKDYAPSVVDTVILAPLIFIIAFSNVFAMNILTPMGNDKFFLYAVTSGMILSLLINIPLIIVYKDTGASIGLFLTELLICFILGFYVKKTWRLTIHWGRVGTTFIALVPFYLIHLCTGLYISNFIVSFACNVLLCGFYWLLVQIFIFKNIHYFDWIKQTVFSAGRLKSGKSL